MSVAGDSGNASFYLYCCPNDRQAGIVRMIQQQAPLCLGSHSSVKSGEKCTVLSIERREEASG